MPQPHIESLRETNLENMSASSKQVFVAVFHVCKKYPPLSQESQLVWTREQSVSETTTEANKHINGWLLRTSVCHLKVDHSHLQLCIAREEV